MSCVVRGNSWRVSSSSQRYFPGLDGLRAGAVIAVLAFHDGRLRGGFLGVSTFFTLSGFLITGLLLSERAEHGRIALRAFFARRIRRLLPIALIGIALGAIATSLLHDPTSAPAFRGDALSALANVANWRFLFAGQAYASQFGTPSVLLHYWSLAVEEQFYLLLAPFVAVLLWLTRGRRSWFAAALGLLTAGSIALGAWSVGHGSFDRAYYGTDTRAAEFLIGGILAAWLSAHRLPLLKARAQRALNACGIGAFSVCIWAMTQARVGDSGLFRGELVAYALLTTLVISSALVPGPLQRLLSWRPLCALGRVSYGVYVVHWPLFLLITTRRTGLSSGEVSAIRVIASVTLASALYRLLEMPIRNRRVLRSRRQNFAAVAAGITTCLLVALNVGEIAPPLAIHFAPVAALTPSAAAPSTMSTSLQRLLAMVHRTTTSKGPAPTSPTTVRTVARGTGTTPTSRTPHPYQPVPAPPTSVAPRVAPRILVVGDSVALTLGRGIQRWGARLGIEVSNYGKLGCGLLDNADVRGYWGIEHRGVDACGVRQQWRQAIAALHPDVVVVLFGAWDVYDASWDGRTTWASPGSSLWNMHYRSSVNAANQLLGAGGARVLWIAPPCFTDTSSVNDAKAPWYSHDRIVAVGNVEKAVASSSVRTSVTDLVQQRDCPVNLRLRPDGVHYSDPGADAEAAALSATIARLF